MMIYIFTPFLLLLSGQQYQTLPMSDSTKIKVEQIAGTKNDIKKVLFLLRGNDAGKEGTMVISYLKDYRSLEILSGRRVIAKYFIDAQHQGKTIIKNRLKLPPMFSFKPTDAREYERK
jgi:hypothetical protein